MSKTHNVMFYSRYNNHNIITLYKWMDCMWNNEKGKVVIYSVTVDKMEWK